MKNIIYTASYITIITAFGLLLMASFWMFFPYKTVEVRQQIKTSQIEYLTGESIIYTVDFCRYTTHPAAVSRFVVSNSETGEKYFLSNLQSNFPTGCNVVKTRTPAIPDSVPQGEYYLEIIVRYRVNPLRVIEKTFNTNTFTINY